MNKLSTIFIQLSIYILLIFANADEDDDPVTCGSVLKLQNVADPIRLHSHEVKYGSGSGQQSVTGMANSDDVNSHWQILARKY
jgi:dolichyl-phosphate-mannose--protein O-mannosyl transferase